MITIILPWPPRELHPNARVHWSKRAKAAKAARAAGGWATKAAGVRKGDPDIPQAVKAAITFYPPDNRRRDVDGMLSNVKSYLDGIADVIGVDDSKWAIEITRGSIWNGGEIHITIQEQEAAA